MAIAGVSLSPLHHIPSSAPGCSTYLNTSIIRAPSNEGDLAPLALSARQIVVEVVDGVSGALGQGAALGLALGVDELLAEGVPVGLLGRGLDDNRLVVVGQRVDDVLDRLAQLQLVELGDALGRDLDSVEGLGRGSGLWGVSWGLLGLLWWWAAWCGTD